VQLLDQPAVVLQDVREDVDRRHDADRRVPLLHEQVAREVRVHQVGAVALGDEPHELAVLADADGADAPRLQEVGGVLQPVEASSAMTSRT
jgi:hypothetical protein